MEQGEGRLHHLGIKHVGGEHQDGGLPHLGEECLIDSTVSLQVKCTYDLCIKKITGENIDCYLGGEISLNPVGVFDKLTVCRLPQFESILLLLEEEHAGQCCSCC